VLLFLVKLGWVPKPNLIGADSKTYILDFFGSKSLRNNGGVNAGAGKGLSVPPERFLTAFGSPLNTFLGYYMDNSSVKINREPKKQQGVIWGKDVKHFKGNENLLMTISRHVSLISTATAAVFRSDGVKWIGHQTPDQWMAVLKTSKFLIGLGNPILGPSAIDAVSVGCMFLNPVLQEPKVVNGFPFASQHPYAQSSLGAPYVCSYKQHDADSLMACVQKALKTELSPFIPSELTFDSHVSRVRKIFNL
jgi:hypothetical protein